MASRLFAGLFAVMAMMLFLSEPVFSGGDKAHEGTVVKASKGKLVMTAKGETKQHTHDVAPKAKITLDGKAAHLEDLKEGFHIHVHMDQKHKVTAIHAHSKEKKE